jgi:uncharacterized protein
VNEPRVALPEPAAAPERALMLDLARACALFGIAVVNVGLFAYPGEASYYAGALATPLDRAFMFTVMALFALKAYTLFSFGFGAGFGQQMQAAAAAGRAFGARYARRLLGLAPLGLINVVALFYGDILFVYAVLGAVLLLFRRTEPKRLVRWGMVLYGLQVALFVVGTALIALWAATAPEDMALELARLPQELAKAAAGFGAPGFTEVAAHRMRTWAQDIGLMMLIQGSGVFAFFLVGLAAWRNGQLADPAHAFWRLCRTRHLPLGLLISAAGAALMVGAEHLVSPRAMLGFTLATLGSPLSTIGYLGLIARWAQAPDHALRRFMARAGSASLSAYLLQGLVMSLVFSGYGLGWYGQLGAAACVAIGAAAGAASLLAMGWWRGRFAQGPFEWLLRRWTYLGRA